MVSSSLLSIIQPGHQEELFRGKAFPQAFSPGWHIPLPKWKEEEWMGKMNEISLNFICASFLQSSLRNFMLGQASIFRVFPFSLIPPAAKAIVSNHSSVSFIYLSHFIRFRTKGYHNFVVSALPSSPKFTRINIKMLTSIPVSHVAGL